MPKGSRGRARGEAGLTLVEVGVVVSVLALVLALAAPAIPRARSGADATAHALARVLGRARLAAVSGGTEVAVEIDAVRAELRVLARGPDGADSLLAAAALPVAGGTRLEVAGGTVRFGPLGRAEGGPVRLRDAADRGWTVEVDPWTGRVRVAAE
jgi:Tfp pilus assembly protein FimT